MYVQSKKGTGDIPPLKFFESFFVFPKFWRSFGLFLVLARLPQNYEVLSIPLFCSQKVQLKTKNNCIIQFYGDPLRCVLGGFSAEALAFLHCFCIFGTSIPRSFNPLNLATFPAIRLFSFLFCCLVSLFSLLFSSLLFSSLLVCCDGLFLFLFLFLFLSTPGLFSFFFLVLVGWLCWLCRLVVLVVLVVLVG